MLGNGGAMPGNGGAMLGLNSKQKNDSLDLHVVILIDYLLPWRN